MEPELQKCYHEENLLKGGVSHGRDHITNSLEYY